MSAFDADIFYLNNLFLAQYVGNTTKVLFEKVSASLVRSVPEDLLEHTDLTSPWMGMRDYGLTFQEGDEVEVQWSDGVSSFFAWWRGIVQSVNQEEETMVVIFPQFEEGSFWYVF